MDRIVGHFLLKGLNSFLEDIPPFHTVDEIGLLIPLVGLSLTPWNKPSGSDTCLELFFDFFNGWQEMTSLELTSGFPDVAALTLSSARLCVDVSPMLLRSQGVKPGNLSGGALF